MIFASFHCRFIFLGTLASVLIATSAQAAKPTPSVRFGLKPNNTISGTGVSAGGNGQLGMQSGQGIGLQTKPGQIAPSQVTSPNVVAGYSQTLPLRPTAPGELVIRWGLFGNLTVDVPAGVLQVTLEKRQGKGWKPVDVRYTNGIGTQVSFAVPGSIDVNAYRAMGSSKRKFTSAQLSATSSFDQGVTGNGSLVVTQGIAAVNRDVTIAASSSLTINGSTTANFATATTSNTGTLTTTPSASTVAATDSAVESDIWKFAGDRLFYFNQLRGLQVFDMKDPAKPVKTGGLRMPAVGTQLQVLDDKGRYVVLFARDVSTNGYYSYSPNGVLHVVEISNEGVPKLLKSITLDGAVGESRLIGSRLYVITSKYNYYPSYLLIGGGYVYRDNFDWTMHGYDLATPGDPVDLGVVTGNGSTPVIQASGGYLLVAGGRYSYTYSPSYSTRNWSEVTAIALSDDGKMTKVKTVEPKQRVQDLFKMSVVKGALVTVTQEPLRYVWGLYKHERILGDDGLYTHIVTNSYKVYPSHTWVETFSLTDGSNTAMAQLHLDAAQGETLHATRFDGSRLYVVTFGKYMAEEEVVTDTTIWRSQWYDPLFIVDLSDPAQPRVRGQLEVPGYSTYLDPNGDRLIAVGREDGKIATALYDVADADAPKQLARVYPGGDAGTYSWSDAEWEHRAVTYLRDQGKLIIPVQTYTADYASVINATRTVNVARDGLTLGPVVALKSKAERGTAMKGYLVSISMKELSVASDPSSGGESKEVAWLELAWPVEKVYDVGDYLVQVESSGYYWARSWWGWIWGWGSSSKQNVLRVTSKQDPDKVLDSVQLPGSGQVIAVTKHDDLFCLAELVPANSVSGEQVRTWMLRLKGQKLEQAGDASAVLPAIQGTSQKDGYNYQLYFDYYNTKPVWVNGSTLVWLVPCQTSFWYNYWWRWEVGVPIQLTISSNVLVSRQASTATAFTASTNTITPVIATSAGTTDLASETKSQNQGEKTKHEDRPIAVVVPVQVSAGGLTAGNATTVRVPMDVWGNSYRDVFGSIVYYAGCIGSYGSYSSWLSAPTGQGGYLFFGTVQPWNYALLNERQDSNNSARKDKTEWTGGSSLHVLDFTGGLEPVVRDPVSLPGTLLSVSSVDSDGAWIITDNGQWPYEPDGSYSQHFISLAYDGVKAHRVDELRPVDAGRRYNSSYGLVAKDNLLFYKATSYLYDATTYSYTDYRYENRAALQNQASGKFERLEGWISKPGREYAPLSVVNDCLVETDYYSGLAVWKIQPTGRLVSLGELKLATPSYWGYSYLYSYLSYFYNYYRPMYDRLEFSSDGKGAWVPVGDYGVEWVDFIKDEVTTP